MGLAICCRRWGCNMTRQTSARRTRVHRAAKALGLTNVQLWVTADQLAEIQRIAAENAETLKTAIGE